MKKIAALLLAGFLLSGRCWADDTWTCVQSPHFTVLTPVAGEHAHDWAVTMEQFYRGMNAMFHARGPQPPRVTVVLFENDDELSKYKPLENGKPSAMAAFFLRGNGINMIAVSLDNQSDETQRMIQHETVHWYFSTRNRPLPLWLEEGVAEVYSTFRMVDDNTCRFGEAIGHHLDLLRSTDLLPLRRLVRMPRSAVQYNETRRTGILYAESWALCHYLIFGTEARKPGHAGGINRYVNSLSTGAATEEAFIAAFGLNYAQAEEKLDDYIRDGSYHVYQFTLANADVERTLRISSARPGDCDLALGSLLLGNRSPAEAEPQLRRAAAELPGDPRPLEMLGDLALQEKDFPGAIDWFNKAIAAGADDYFVYFNLACSHLGQASDGQSVFSGGGEEIESSAALLRKALKLNPGYMPAFHNLAGLIPGLETVDPGDVALMQFAAELAPDDEMIKVALGVLEMKTGHDVEGRRRLTALLSASYHSGDADARTIADQVLQNAAQKDFQDKLSNLQSENKLPEIVALIDSTEASGYFPEPKRQLDAIRREAMDFQRIRGAQNLARSGKLKEAEKALSDLIAEPDVSGQASEQAQKMLEGFESLDSATPR